MNNNNVILKVFISTLSIVMVAVLGSIFVNIGMEWFNGLLKPTQWIPNIIIPIVWTIIYITFAIILFLWLKKENLPRKVLILLILNGILNILWCLIFFTLNLTFLGNVIIIINAILGVTLIINIYKTKPLYSTILSIYPIWICIATSLNTALWILN